MANEIEYVVSYIPSGEKFTTRAVSSIDAINHVHYRLWFGLGIWTSMEDFKAEATIITKFRKLKNDNTGIKKSNTYAGADEKLRGGNKEEYVQMSLPF